MRRGRQAGLAAALLSVVVLGACTDAGAADPTPPAETTDSVSPGPEPSPSPTSTMDIAAVSAESLVREFYRVNDVVRSNHDVPLNRLQEVAVGATLKGYRGLYERERQDERHQTGTTQVVDLAVQSVSLDNSDPEVGKVPTVVVDVCIDIRDVDVVDKDGASIADPDRPETLWDRHHVANYSWDDNLENGWRVVSSETLDKTPCAAE
ncbi:hypothetical protein GCM10028784_29800 [Myceligenerans cantabricum]